MKYAILGPTASGKTAYAIALAKDINGAIISADSRQVYAGMNIGTAKPKEAWSDTPHEIDVPDVIEGIPHYLLNIATIDHTYTLSDWLRDAKQVTSTIEALGKVPIIVGGTMLYIDALTDGYNIPEVVPDEEFRAQLENKSPELLYKELRTKDPAASEFIEPHNTRRMIRALEVMHATNKTFSSLRTKKNSDTSWTKIGIFSDWDTQRENVTKRCKEMLAQGLEAERQTLAARFPTSLSELRGAGPTSSLLQTVNYKEKDVEEMVQSNMRYAHRQMSWWKHRKDIGWICI